MKRSAERTWHQEMTLVSDQKASESFSLLLCCTLSLSGTSSTNSRVLTAVIQYNDISVNLCVGKITHIHIGRKNSKKKKTDGCVGWFLIPLLYNNSLVSEFQQRWCRPFIKIDNSRKKWEEKRLAVFLTRADSSPNRFS